MLTTNFFNTMYSIILFYYLFTSESYFFDSRKKNHPQGNNYVNFIKTPHLSVGFSHNETQIGSSLKNPQTK